MSAPRTPLPLHLYQHTLISSPFGLGLISREGETQHRCSLASSCLNDARFVRFFEPFRLTKLRLTLPFFLSFHISGVSQ